MWVVNIFIKREIERPCGCHLHVVMNIWQHLELTDEGLLVVKVHEVEFRVSPRLHGMLWYIFSIMMVKCAAFVPGKRFLHLCWLQVDLMAWMIIDVGSEQARRVWHLVWSWRSKRSSGIKSGLEDGVFMKLAQDGPVWWLKVTWQRPSVSEVFRGCSELETRQGCDKSTRSEDRQGGAAW